MQVKIAALLKEINDKDNVKDYDMDLFENEMLDSLGIAQLIGALEETFHVEIDPEDIVPEHFSTINEIVALITKYQG